MTQPTNDLAAVTVSAETLDAAYNEMRTAVTSTVQQFLDNCPEGFAADTVAEAVVDVCSDELDDLYNARAQRDAYQALLIREGYLPDPYEGVAFGNTTIAAQEA